MAITDHEKRLVERFLLVYNRHLDARFEVTEWPDDLDRTNKRVDAVATDLGGARLAIEHTLLEPFAGERYDTNVFMEALSPLHMKPALITAGLDVSLCVRVRAVPIGIDWSEVPSRVEAWYHSAKAGLPMGRSSQEIQGLGFALQVDIDKDSAVEGGHFFIDRWMPSETVIPVVRRALNTKLGKLTAERADRRVLLLEKNTWPRGYVEIGEAIEALRSEFPLPALDHVWVINTCALDSENYSPSYLVWPAAEKLSFDIKRHGV